MGQVTLINPPLVAMRNDLFTTGIVYMPIGLAYFAGMLQQNAIDLTVIDAFGLQPNNCTTCGNYVIRGISVSTVVEKIPHDTQANIIYANHVCNHVAIMALIESIKANYPKVPIIIIENTQSVTAYSLRNILTELFDNGVDYVVTGEPESRGLSLLQGLLSDQEISSIEGIAYRSADKFVYVPLGKAKNNLDELPFPAWQLFPLEQYWSLHYAHGPLSSPKYLPLQTSRGCPYQCRFCIIPELNNVKWRARSAKNVVDEIEHWVNRLGVREFHLEDVDPTVSDQRVQEICRDIIARKLNIVWKICAGTKVETIKSEQTIELMAAAGCRYISISPESGSEAVMKKINKPFDKELAIRWIKKFNEVGIYTQACFVLGFPEESDLDRELTLAMIKRLVQVGIDEVALFVITPIPGSAIASTFKKTYSSLSDLNFSPQWRDDYQKLNQFRIRCYRLFLFWKLRYQTKKILLQPLRFLSRKFQTKMEMTPYRALHSYLLLIKAHCFGRQKRLSNHE